MRKFIIALLYAAMSVTAHAADLSGDWTGEIRVASDGNTMPAFLRLEQNNSTVTGKAGPNAEQLFPIRRASFSDNELKIETSAHSTVLLVFELTLRDKSLAGQLFEDGSLVGPVELQRAE